MKKVILFFGFTLTMNFTFSQLNTKLYSVKKSPESFEVSKIENIDPFMIDLYRSQSVDNEVVLDVDGESVTIILTSADKLKQQGVQFDEGLVKKGAMMSGNAANTPRTFIWKLEENKKIKDLTVQ